MSVESLLIHFQYGDENPSVRGRPRDFYLPGDVLRGVVVLHLSSGLRVRGLTMHFLGTATVSWEAANKVYQSSEVYLEEAKPLLNIDPNNLATLPRGVHEFGFRLELQDDLPSTFTGVYGQVTYLAKVFLDSEDERNTTVTSQPFLVLRRPEPQLEIYDEKTLTKKKTYLGWTTGKVHITCTIDRSLAVPGDNIIINAEVSNRTGRQLSLIQAALIQEGHYKAEGRRLVFRQYLSKRDDVYDVNFEHGRRWHNIQLPVPPYLADAGLENCNIMEVRYFFHFKVRIEGKRDIVVETPMEVGVPSMDFEPGGKGLLLRRMYQGLEDEQRARDYLSNDRGLPYYSESIVGGGDHFHDRY